MDAELSEALAKGGIVDLTTTGRNSGTPRRITIYLHSFDGELYLTGRPGFRRDWIANIGADPKVTLHLKGGLDVPARARIITDPEEKAALILRARVESWGGDPEKAGAELGHWVATSPAVQLNLD